MHHKGTLHSERGYLNGLIDVNQRSQHFLTPEKWTP
jgi:hypothetical protein